MAHSTPPIPIHCYTNPSFCQQSEYISNELNDDLPPPPLQQFQTDELPPPPPLTPPHPISHTTPIRIQNQQPQSINNYQSNYGHTNPAFQTLPEQNCIQLDTQVRYAKTPDRYCYLEDNNVKNAPIIETKSRERQIIYDRHTGSRYEYIVDDEPIPLQPQNQLQRRASSTQIEMVNHRQNTQFHRQPSYHGQRMQTALSVPINRIENDANNTTKIRRLRQDGNDVIRYALVPADEAVTDGDSSSWINGNYSSPRGNFLYTPSFTVFFFLLFLLFVFH